MKFVGEQKIGNYRVVRALGTGGMGEVYEVEHLRLGTHYALKAFTLSHGEVHLLKKRFMAEGKVLARLRHPNIARVHELDFDVDSGFSYFVMDLVLSDDGSPRSLADISPDTATEANLKKWFIQLCSALDYIHKKGIVHRDVKPANILIDESGNAVLSDFGISRYVNDDLRRQIGVTVANANGMGVDVTRQMILGTDAYMAPEVRMGREAVPASDAYSLGLVFFHLLTGVWFEPRRDVFDLLSSFDAMWARVLPRLLDADADIRPVALVTFVLGDQWKHRWVGRSSFFGVLAVLQLLSCVGVFAVGVFYGHRLPPPNYGAEIRQLQKQCQQVKKELDDYKREVSGLQDKVKIVSQEKEIAVLKANEARRTCEDYKRKALELQNKVEIANKERENSAKHAKELQEGLKRSERRVRELQAEVERFRCATYEAERRKKIAQDYVNWLEGVVRKLDKKGEYSNDLNSPKDKGIDPVRRIDVPPKEFSVPVDVRGSSSRWSVPNE